MANPDCIWARIDVQIFEHPKMVALGPLAVSLHVRAILYAREHLTDGVVPKRIVETWEWQVARDASLSADTPGMGLAGALVAAGVWEDAGDTFTLTSFLDFQESASAIEEQREKKRMAARKRWDKREDSTSDAPSNATALHRVCKTDAETETETETEKEEAKASSVSAPDVERVWSAYQAHHPRARMDSKRRELIRRRLADFSADVLVQAIEGNHRSPWHRGENPDGKPYHDLGLILRSADHVERFAGMAAETPAQSLAAKRNLSARDLDALADAMERGRDERDRSLASPGTTQGLLSGGDLAA